MVRSSKIVIYAVKGLGAHDVGTRAAALTYFTLMAIVPVAALIFGVVKGFGLEGSLTSYLYATFSDHSDIVDYLLRFADNMLGKARGGIVAAFGFIILFWTVVQVFSNIENAFNNIWEVKKKRSLARKFSDYLVVIMVAPVLFIISNNLFSSLRHGVERVSGGWAADAVFGLISLAAIWLMFAVIYFMMPNTKVKIKGALIAGIIAGTSFYIFQSGYFWIQRWLNTYNIVYGSFAFLPLLLLFVQWSWMILLVGAELSFAYQNITDYEQEREALNMSYDHRRKVLLAVMITVGRHFIEKQCPVKSEEVAREIKMPVRTVRDVIFDLESAGLVVAVKNGNDDMVNLYMPAKDIHTMTVCDVVNGVEDTGGSSSHIHFDDNVQLTEVNRVLNGMREASEDSQYNMSITELMKKVEQ